MPLTLDGTNGVSAVQTGAVESGDLASGAIGSGDLPAGSVIQVNQNFSDTLVSTTSGGEVSLGLTISITPTSTSSKFLIIGSVSAYLQTTGSGFGLRVKRDTTVIRSTALESFISDGVDSLRTKPTCSVLDSPNTTNSITYEVLPVQFGADALQFNESAGDRGQSEIIVMEIAG